MTDEPDHINVTRHVKEIRKKLGLSQKHFAEAIGVTQSAVSKWENGTQNPDLNSTIKMQAIFILKEGEEHRYKKRSWGIEVNVVGAINESKWLENYRWSYDNEFKITVPRRAAWEDLDLIGFHVQDDSADPVYPRESVIVCSGANFRRWMRPRSGDNVVVAERHVLDASVRVVVRQLAIGRRGELVLNSYSNEPVIKKALTMNQALDMLAAGGFESLGLIGVIVGGFIVEDPNRFRDPEF